MSIEVEPTDDIATRDEGLSERWSVYYADARRRRRAQGPRGRTSRAFRQRRRREQTMFLSGLCVMAALLIFFYFALVR
ncbi:MAG TPA: hypothetical protein VHK47_24330 [Polyangia bacterium]|nr:hypothetical protein [Polyangia bacterium]